MYLTCRLILHATHARVIVDELVDLQDVVGSSLSRAGRPVFSIGQCGRYVDCARPLKMPRIQSFSGLLRPKHRFQETMSSYSTAFRGLQALRQSVQSSPRRSLHSAVAVNANRAALPLHRRQVARAASIATQTLKSFSQSRCLSTSPVRQAKELPPRSDKFKKITKEDIAAFKEITSGVMSTVEGASTTSQDELVPFNEDWM